MNGANAAVRVLELLAGHPQRNWVSWRTASVASSRTSVTPFGAMDSSTFSFTILQITLVVMITGVVFWGVADWARTRKMQPIIDQERAMRLQVEVKRQDEAQIADEYRDKTEARLKESFQRQTNLERTLAATQEQLKTETEHSAARIAALEEELRTTQGQQRDVEGLLASSRSRVADLESALNAEKGRIAAMQEALEAKQDLAKQLAQELSSARHSFADERRVFQERESAMRSQLADHEKQAATGQSMTDVINAELEKTRAAQAELERESTAKMSELTRRLAAADQKSALLQKEIMALVSSTGNPAEAAAAVTAAEEITQAQERARQAERRAAELEAQLAQGDAGTRKRLREAEYRICELEFKLAQVDEAPPAQAAETSQPRAEA